MRIGKLETMVLALFGSTLIIWLVDRAAKTSITSFLLTISWLALLIVSITLFVLSLKTLLQRRKAKAVAKKPKKRRR